METTVWLIERAIDGEPHWLAWRGRDEMMWIPDVMKADRYEWAFAAHREARRISALGIPCVATEHTVIPSVRDAGGRARLEARR